MNLSISTNTQAILLLTAPLITGKNGSGNGELLMHGEYRRYARQLRHLGLVPADLLGTKSAELLRELETVIPADRVSRLLDRGFLMSQAVERWQSCAIWILSRADPEYSKKMKDRLKEDAPAVLYGCGQPTLLESGGLAVVGSRHVDEALIEYSEAVGRQCALAKKNVISGAAPGIDRAAMRGALQAGGRATGVLADSLERAALNRENRNWLLEEQLALVSPYDPSAGFNIGHAMQRNKVIYALADVALVVSAEYEKGGTWAGATEQLQKLRFIPVYVRSNGEIGRGLEGLAHMGAQPWPNPQHSDEFLAIFDWSQSKRGKEQPKLAFQSATQDADTQAADLTHSERAIATIKTGSDVSVSGESQFEAQRNTDTSPDGQPAREPAQALIACVRDILSDLLASPKAEAEVAVALQVSSSQARLWLQELVREGLVEKRTKPVRFVVQQKRLL